MFTERFPALGPVPRGALTPHRTLGASVAWSVDLLSAPDRALLLRLWPFEGGFPLTAPDDSLEALSTLVARSVVVADTTVTRPGTGYSRSCGPTPAARSGSGGQSCGTRGLGRELVEKWAPQLRVRTQATQSAP